jgi:SAM-dependent methyltransferase
MSDPAAEARFAETLRSLVEGVPWCCDNAIVTPTSIEMRGWALAPGGDPKAVRFYANDVECTERLWPIHRPDLAQLLWFLPEAGSSGFRCRVEVDTKPLFASGHVELQLRSADTGKPFDPELSYYLPDVAADTLPFPDAPRRTRVHGSDREMGFRLEGYSAYVKLQKVLARHGRALDDGLRILDWGCGCGRLIRYLSGLRRSQVTGVDIDADNVAWCREHLPFGRFEAIATAPPMSFAAESFDVVIGISIFTHLAEAEQLAWLRELRRITAPGALLLMTTHGQTAAYRSALPPEQLDAWRTAGFLDRGRDAALDGVLADPEYYRTVFHSRAYIESRWSEYLEVVDFRPGFIGNNQDLVVLRRR